MKNVYLFCSKLWVYLTEVPVLVILWFAVFYNRYSDGVLKFYPLIIVCCLAVIFIMLYFFRFISINTDEIRYHGLFSSRDSALINENKTLVMILKPRKNMKLELYTDAAEEPAFEWMKAEDVKHRDVCIFRGKAVGGKGSAKKVLSYFSVPKEELESTLIEGYKFENEAIRVETKTENEVQRISIKFKITII